MKKIIYYSTIWLIVIFSESVSGKEKELKPGDLIPIPNADFSLIGEKPGEIINWKYVGPLPKEGVVISDKKHQKFFSPTLAFGEKCTLTSSTILLEPHTQYILEMDVKGGIFNQWQIDVIYHHKDMKDSIWRRFPNAHTKGAPPSPGWEKRQFKFVTPRELTGATIRFIYHSTGINPSQPGMDNLKLVYLGRQPIISLPEKNLLPDPGFEIRLKSEEILRETSARADYSAHSGIQFYRLTGKKWHWTLIGSAYIRTPVVIKFATWAKGKGRMFLHGRGYSYGYKLIQDHSSPEFTLTNQWKYYTWEYPLSLEYPELIFLEYWVSVDAEKNIDLDDTEFRVVSRKIRVPKVPIID